MTYSIAIATGLTLFAGSGLARHDGVRLVFVALSVAAFVVAVLAAAGVIG
ncbi:hypothetical protein [Amycolatopsis sp. cmx-8-4]